MANVYEDYSLSFADLEEIIRQSLSGNVVGEMKEKTDGQAIAMSFAKKRVLFARNKGHYSNHGAGALKGSKGVIDAFEGHPNSEITKAFSYAAKDLEKAILSLDPEDQYQYFKEGARWVNIEIIWPETVNVIPYNHRLLVLHNYKEYDIDGKVVGGDFNEYGKIIADLLERTNENVQEKFTITSMPILKLPKSERFAEEIPKYIGVLDTIRANYQLAPDDAVGEYWVSYMANYIRNSGFPVTEDVVALLAFRWAYKNLTPTKRPGDWSTNAVQRLSDLKNLVGASGKPFLDWVRDIERNGLKGLHAEMVQPIKDAFLQLGVQVVKNMSNLLTLDPSEATQRMRRAIDEVIKDIGESGDEKLEELIATQLKQIQKAGGLDAIVPTEGLTFTYTPINSTEQRIYKFTGIFAPINQILGVRFGNR